MALRGLRLGVVVNPVAGLGGRTGLHGTDGAALDAARDRGALPVAEPRARRALARLRPRLASDVEVVTASGAMGADLLDALDWPHEVVHLSADPSGPADTRATVAALRSAGAALVLFAGGDGTARDVLAAADDATTMLGVPAGVKMHSGVFATSPEAAADLAARYLADPDRTGTVEAEVVDRDAEGSPPVLHGIARVPAGTAQLVGAKAAPAGDDDAALAALGREVAGEVSPGQLLLLGPGTTVAHVSRSLGVPTSVLGVDAVLDGRLVGRDLSESQLRALLAVHPDARLVLGVVGGQGFLLGRGNQQLSPEVLAAVGRENVVVLAAAGKVAALDPPVLRVDAGDVEPESPLSGYLRVRTAPGRSTVLKIEGTNA